MIFSSIKGVTIPEGVVKQIADSAGRILWKGGAVDVAALAISYSGAYTDQKEVTMSGKKYRLLTLTGSGVLTIQKEVMADVWMCNGGIGGGYLGTGGGGGRVKQNDGILLAATTVCTVGAGSAGAKVDDEASASGLSSFGSISPSPNQGGVASGTGASGGGGSGSANRSKAGDKATTVPFSETSIFEAHSAGGGGGGVWDRSEAYTGTGGAGGSNGADGDKVRAYGTETGGLGGTRGGGAGAKATASGTNAGGNATYYGSGGGGGGAYWSSAGINRNPATGGAGYQGVIYVRIPHEQ